MADQHKISTIWLLRYLKPVKGRIILLLILLLGSTGLQLMNPQVIQRFIDAASGGGGMSELLELAALFLVLAVVNQTLGVAVTYLGSDVSWRTTNRLRGDLAHRPLPCLRSPKNSQPFQRVPVIARAMADSDL